MHVHVLMYRYDVMHILTFILRCKYVQVIVII